VRQSHKQPESMPLAIKTKLHKYNFSLFFRKLLGKVFENTGSHLDIFSSPQTLSKNTAGGDDAFSHHPWINIPGNFEIGFIQGDGFVVKNGQDQLRGYKNLQESEKRVLIEKMLRALHSMIATEQVHSKHMLDRFEESKILLKRMKENERMAEPIKLAIQQCISNAQLMATLLKAAKRLKYPIF